MSQTASHSAMLKHFFAAAFTFDKPKHVGVAVSGGGDSMALLRLMADWGVDQGVRVSAVTVNHGLRPEAASEAQFVAETCEKLKIKHTTLTWTGWSGDGNLQDAARRARYHLMGQWAATQDITTIALGHTADDQAETFFMRLARASGIDGLTGMQRRRQSDGITWVRPLLMQERFELRQYLRDLRQPWIDDPSNDDEAYDRVKSRKAMAALTDLGIDAHVVGRVMDHLSQVQSALDIATHDHAIDCVEEDRGDLIVHRKRFAEGAPEVNRRLVAHALKWIASADYGPRGMKLQEFMSAMVRKKDATLHGVRMIGQGETFRLCREFSAVSDKVSVPNAIWDGRWQVNCDKTQDLIVRALGEDGLLKLGPRADGGLPRESLKSTPAVFLGDMLLAAPLANPATPAGQEPIFADAKLIHPRGQVYTSLLSH
ncbi:tRNA lysidine(34) synthetase TilS [Pacificibacter marinus]|uniref:tRNA(Ile)-lysidine synthase n=1 Tax=Pacificibacter marinus TaxID=658057 RepID=A0A1Y5RKY5_9RHOB|nr:tRNA lysidine(34) synthetase TilS [Pacificibacter marinus]SEK19694.1 tRNA(Ile)-lysidine synthase [Pacificibacter marinus]SLN17017.1 tRNA(Ile)-lysidine synthase [Pacificibacter marinus]